MRQVHPRPMIENYNHSNLRTTPQVKQRPSLCGVQVCFNHEEKVATHTLNHPETNQLLFYCEKCSIMLASKGHNIVKLGRNSSNGRRTVYKQPVKTERQREIEQFLGQLAWNIEEINKRYEYTENLLITSEEHFNLITQEITSYFKEIEDILEIQKFMSYNAILNHRATVESELRMMRESMHQEIQELISIGNDIQNNMEAVEMVELHIYESIMDNYKEKVALAADYQDVDLSTLPAPTLVFPDIPKVLYSLADKINLKSEIPPSQTNAIPKPSLSNRSNRSNISRNQSCENSRAKPTNVERSRQCLSNLANIKNAQSIDDRQIVFSFESNQNNDDNFIHKALFSTKINREVFHPQQMVFRESLSLTEIRENDEQFQTQGYRRYGNLLQETIPIPEQAMTSQQSLNGYFATNTLNYSLRDANQRNEETETLLIC